MVRAPIALSSFLALLAPLVAQGGDGDAGTARTGIVQPVPTADTGKKLESNRTMTPIRSTFAASGTIALQPRRLAPSQSGELCFVIMLKDNLVALPGIDAELSFEPGDCPCTLGRQTVDPPGTGKLATRFRGKPVHEETVVVRVKIDIHPGAAFRRYPVAGTVGFMVHDAVTGRPLGKLSKRVRGTVHVGKPLPTFTSGAAGDPRRTAKTKTPAPGAAATGGSAGAAGSAGSAASAETGEPKGRMQAAPRAVADDRETGARGPDAPVPPSWTGTWPWILAGVGGLMLGLIVLLRSRRGG